MSTTDLVAASIVAPHGRQYSSFSKAAKAAHPAPSIFSARDHRAHLLRRATFGASPADVKSLAKLGVNKWLAKQLKPETLADPQGDAAWRAFPLAGASAATITRSIPRYSWEAMFQTSQAALARQMFSSRQLYEVVVDIFANHLHVAIPGEQWNTSPDYLRTVIRAHAFGRYSDMLVAAMRHPAMLTYLGNDQSRKAAVNENLGRELLELHTVGVTAGYTEADVKASAAILSGRTWNWQTGQYVFDASQHVTGRVRVMGFTHSNAVAAQGHAVGDAYLHYLAMHPATARMIARIIATRFVSDTPSADLVNRLARVYLAHGSDIRQVVKAVFRSSDFWASVGTRMRRPLEDAVGAVRAIGISCGPHMAAAVANIYWYLDSSGQTPFGWNPPNGYPDVADAWLGAGSMIQRWNLHRVLVYGWWSGLGYRDPATLVKRVPGMTASAWARAAAKRLLHTTPSTRHLSAVLVGAGLRASAPAPTSSWECGKVASLLLDSAYFQLR
ncbi:DUF1800 domain-containing protein [Galbitalea soli]|uniref:DUF1800 domain-containing protein n=1 Tax=Galbitalea soli TaxID=1268042 RepID=A0A7C9TQ35_9MICO|nr:DUF1800 domain-containing protein [Galbitalea soli]NEM90719.1 DUF1800 domain-containing protein [Galbitalea soli]NYJ31437.1 uncharacterized protein (DUF1800 family) [Galbitalea soli]